MRQEIKIGLFLSIGLIILAVFIFVVGDISTMFEKKGYTLYTYFDSVAGLERKTVVRMAGVKVGAVEAITLKGSKAEVAMDIQPDIEISRDSRATLASLGLLGEKYIEITPGIEEEVVQPGGTIGSLPPVSFDQLGIILSSVGDDIKSTSRAMRELLGEGEARVNIKEILQNLSMVSAELKEFIGESRPHLTQSLDKASLAIDTFDQNVHSISENLDELILLLKDTVEENRDSLKGNLEGIKELISKMEEALKTLNESLEKINKGEGTLGKLIEDPSLYEKTESIVNKAQDIVSPFSGVQTDLGLRAEYFAKSELFRGILSLGFWPTSDKFLLAQIVSDPWQDKFTYSAQGGIRWGVFAPRAGILESKFGVGLDLYTFKDRVIFTLEGFDFNRNPRPRFRVWTSFIASKYVHILLGWDDFALSENREFYLGMRFGF
ncbi:MAG: MCE family protein [Candidatus Aminicenantes bacterium]|nr:MAG: MCE family protein [Candidatus Aminicenantes bacterium]